MPLCLSMKDRKLSQCRTYDPQNIKRLASGFDFWEHANQLPVVEVYRGVKR